MSNPNRKPLRTVNGRCRWLHEPIVPCAQFPDGLPGLLLIETDHICTVYMLSVVVNQGAVAGFRLTKSDGKVYDIDPAHWTCDCPDGTFRQNRPGGCKHGRAVRAALARIGIQLPAPNRNFRSSADIARNAPELLPGYFGDEGPDNAA
jgi:hypothetical protein